ncbi:MAG: hypothetical protein RJA99_258 [Pseudomonadota bacterium]
MDYDPEPGLADNGDLEHDLQSLFEQVGRAAKAAGTAEALFIDELQYVAEDQLAVLITAMHRIEQLQLPVVLVGAGLPRSAAERAIRVPLQKEGVEIEDAALDRLVEVTHGYACFLQQWGFHTWEQAAISPIGIDAVLRASGSAVAALDESFFRVRFDRLTPKEKRYLRAMAELGPGPHRSGDIATCYGAKVTSLAPTRSSLITKGMVWSPSHGDTAYTVPMFDEFMKRIIPDADWRRA